MTTTGLSEIDRTALERGLRQAKAGNASERARFEAMLAREGWLETACRAVYARQIIALGISKQPWRAPPMDAADEVGEGYAERGSLAASDVGGRAFDLRARSARRDRASRSRVCLSCGHRNSESEIS
jgi:hypothetical protein